MISLSRLQHQSLILDLHDPRAEAEEIDYRGTLIGCTRPGEVGEAEEGAAAAAEEGLQLRAGKDNRRRGKRAPV
jgi:hypothetical protein